ncbi:hypothetical protein D3C78_1881960 [compost metagenome]
MLLQVGGHFRAQNGVTRNQQRFLVRMAKYHAAGLAEAFCQLRHGVGAVGAVLPSVGFA